MWIIVVTFSLLPVTSENPPKIQNMEYNTLLECVNAQKEVQYFAGNLVYYSEKPIIATVSKCKRS